MKNTLWFPDGVKKGAVVYDLQGNPYAVGERVVDGVTNIREISPIEKVVAEAMKKGGAEVIVSIEG